MNDVVIKGKVNTVQAHSDWLFTFYLEILKHFSEGMQKLQFHKIKKRKTISELMH